RSSRAQCCAPEHASIPTTHAGSCANNSSSLPRRTAFLSVGLPCSSTPCTLNTLFAKSTPTVVIFIAPPPLIDWTRTHFQSGTVDAVRAGGGHSIRSSGQTPAAQPTVFPSTARPCSPLNLCSKDFPI